MKCPVCKKGTIALCQDAILSFNIHPNMDGKLMIGTQLKEGGVNYLDNTWVECNECRGTSDSEDKTNYKPELEKIWEQL